MPRLPISEQALRLALTRPAAASRPSQYVCRACVRQYHPSPALRAELPFWKRMTNSLFGSTEQKAAAEKRDEAHQNRLNELAEQGGGKTETFVDDQGRKWTIAAVVDPSINKEYVQAQRWDGLEWVGSKEWIARRSDAGETYIGFNPRRKLDFSPDEWLRLLHHVTVEAMVLVQAGRDVNALWTERAVNSADWRRTARVKVNVVNGAVELQFPTEEMKELTLKAMPQSLAEEIVKAAENAENGETIEDDETTSKPAKGKSAKGKSAKAKSAEQESTEEANTLSASFKQADIAESGTMRAISKVVKINTSRMRSNPRYVVDTEYLQTPLTDPAIKLAILKRVQQLSGHRARDSVVSNATTMQGLYNGLKIRPESEKLWQAQELKKLDVALPNVTVHKVRQTPIHKHQQVGRWKVIEEELITRGLPVTGSRWQGAKTTSPVL